MTRPGYAQSYRELIAYQKSRQLASDIYRLTKSFPKSEMYSLTDQIRRSSRSIGAQIAEAWAKRRYEKHFVSKLTDADGERLETQHWIDVACDCQHITKEQAINLLGICAEIGRMLFSMIQKAEKFCQSIESLREDDSVYDADLIA